MVPGDGAKLVPDGLEQLQMIPRGPRWTPCDADELLPHDLVQLQISVSGPTLLEVVPDGAR